MMSLSPLLLILASVLCSSVAQVALKLAAPRINVEGPIVATIARLATNGWLIGGIVLYMVALLLWIPGLKRMDLSFAYPFISLGVVLVTIFSWLLLKETIGMVRLLGIMLIVAGLLCVAGN